jgi:hypothetical protein
MMKVWRDVPQNIHFKDFWSRTFCNVGGSVSSAIEVYNNRSRMGETASGL